MLIFHISRVLLMRTVINIAPVNDGALSVTAAGGGRCDQRPLQPDELSSRRPSRRE